MRCPFCNLDNDRVLDTRPLEDGYAIRRRRGCFNCERRFSTIERVERTTIRVIKRDESREPFDSEKLAGGIERACWKRKVSTERIQSVVQQIENELYEDYGSEVESETIGEMVMRHLVNMDQVAYVRFVSVYKDFNNVNDFLREIRSHLPRES